MCIRDRGQTIRMMATGAEYTILECGYLKPIGNEPTDALQAEMCIRDRY